MATFDVNGSVVYTPHARQLVFHECPAKYPLFGGARGPGKSWAMRWHFHMCCMTVPNFHALLLRRHLMDLKRSHVRFLPDECDKIGATWRKSDGGAGEVQYPNGSLLELGHCQHETDIGNYLSAQYDGAGFDEIVTFTEYQYLMLRTSVRTSKPGLTPRTLGATNPGVSPVSDVIEGLGASWVKRRWIDHDVTLEEDAAYDEAQYAYIPSLLDDNPYINKEDYEKELMSLPLELRRAYRQGEWDLFLGQFFPEFDRAVHVCDESVSAPPSLPRLRGLDWGYASEGVCLWAVVLPSGQLLIEDEYVFNGPRRGKQVAAEVATMIADRTRTRGLARIKGTYADPAMFANTGHVGETIAETFQRHGVPLTEANNERVNGWAKLRAWLRCMPSGRAETPNQPWLLIHPRCAYLIRTIPQMRMDATKPEDLETDSPDHALDCLRYTIAGRPTPTVTVASTDFPIGTAGWIRDQILNGSRRRSGSRASRRKMYAY
jgi:phage terminase large subunit